MKILVTGGGTGLGRGMAGRFLELGAHVVIAGRRKGVLDEAAEEMMYARLVGGIGLTLPQFFQAQALAEQKDYALKNPECDSVIHIFLRGGLAAQETLDD